MADVENGEIDELEMESRESTRESEESDEESSELSIADFFSDDDDDDQDKIKKLERAIRRGQSKDAVAELLEELAPDREERKKLLNTLRKGFFSDGTVLHTAARENKLNIAVLLMNEGADPNIKNRVGRTVLHTACIGYIRTWLFKHDHDVTEIVKLLIERGCSIEAKDKGKKTPLHHLCSKAGNLETIKIFIERNANVNAVDDENETPLCCASEVPTNLEVVKLLVDANAEVNPDTENTPLLRACKKGCSDIVAFLVHCQAKIDSKALKSAVTGGYEDIVKQLLIHSQQWPVLLRQTYYQEWWTYYETTPFREMIRKMPGVAEEVLNRCMVTNSTNPGAKNYRVIYNYEFIEDMGSKESEEEIESGLTYEDLRKKVGRKNYTTTWGPESYDKENHPLAIMVESKRLNLLTHPVVSSLLHHKWVKFGLFFYLMNLISYLIFLSFLTVFALIVENPESPSCLNVLNATNSMNETDLENETNGTGVVCDISDARQISIGVTAVIVILLALLRLLFEEIQFAFQRLNYLKDKVNGIEILLNICSVIFAFVFSTNCFCPLNWQWQIGVVALFLGWITLVFFISKLPFGGLYVLMFVKILKTFLKMLLLSILLVSTFGLTFYLTFRQPEVLRSPFSTPARSLFKIVTMTTGEFEFDSIFRQEPAGERDDAEEIPFPPVSYIIWIFFVIVMPILLTNMLVGLAVADIKKVQNEAQLEKLALQVDQVLSIEQLFPKKLRQKYKIGCLLVAPNQELSWRKKLRKKILYKLWGGAKYDTRESIGSVLHPHEGENSKIKRRTEKVLDEVEKIKAEQMETTKLLQELNRCDIEAMADVENGVIDGLEMERRESMQKSKESDEESIDLSITDFFSDDDSDNDDDDDQDMIKKLERAIERGKSRDAVAELLEELAPDREERKILLNTLRKGYFSDGTVLHNVARENKPDIAMLLMDEGADPNIKNNKGRTVLHMACIGYIRTWLYEHDHDVTEIVKLLIERGCNIEAKDKEKKTPLHHLCSKAGNFETIKFFIERNAEVNAVDDENETPLCCASEIPTNLEVAKLLVDAGAEVDPINTENTPLRRACKYGCSDIVLFLLHHQAKIDSIALKNAVTGGYEDIVKQLLIHSEQWPVLLRQTYVEWWRDDETTPFREMIRKMPGVAEEILNRCMVANSNNPGAKNYRVIYSYEFIEDEKSEESREETKSGLTYEDLRKKVGRKNYTTTWGPEKFEKDNHPLAIMVESKRLNLLTHPVVGSLLHHKWLNFGLFFYLMNLISYLIFLSFLTVFALIVENPESPSCLNVMDATNSMNETDIANGTNGTGLDCGSTEARRIFIAVSASIVIVLALLRLLFEVIQFAFQRVNYIKNNVNWIEILLNICSIIFAFVFNTNCFCPLNWQWQIGVVAVFLGWIILVIFIFISKL